LPQDCRIHAKTCPHWAVIQTTMMEAPETKAHRTGKGTGVATTDDVEVDLNRVVWDQEYRAEILAEMRRRRRLARAHADHQPIERSRAA